MGIALDQSWGYRIAASGLQGVAKSVEVGAQLIGNGAGAFGGRAVKVQPLGPKRLEMAVSAALRLVIGVVARGMSNDTQLTFSSANCFEACNSA